MKIITIAQAEKKIESGVIRNACIRAGVANRYFSLDMTMLKHDLTHDTSVFDGMEMELDGFYLWIRKPLFS